MSALNRKVYTVRGSEDGVIGVFSTKAKAMARAIQYAKADRYEFDALVIDTDSKYINTVASPDVYADVEEFRVQ